MLSRHYRAAIIALAQYATSVRRVRSGDRRQRDRVIDGREEWLDFERSRSVSGPPVFSVSHGCPGRRRSKPPGPSPGPERDQRRRRRRLIPARSRCRARRPVTVGRRGRAGMPTGQLLCPRHSLLHRAGEVVRRLGVPARRPRSVRHDDHVVTRRRMALPAVGQVELVPPYDQDLLARPQATDVVSRGRRDAERRTVNIGVVFVDEGMIAVEIPVVERPHVVEATACRYVLPMPAPPPTRVIIRLLPNRPTGNAIQVCVAVRLRDFPGRADGPAFFSVRAPHQ